MVSEGIKTVQQYNTNKGLCKHDWAVLEIFNGKVKHFKGKKKFWLGILPLWYRAKAVWMYSTISFKSNQNEDGDSESFE